MLTFCISGGQAPVCGVNQPPIIGGNETATEVASCFACPRDWCSANQRTMMLEEDSFVNCLCPHPPALGYAFAAACALQASWPQRQLPVQPCRR